MRLSLIFLAFMIPALASAQQPAKELFGRTSNASRHQPEAIGTYAKGCVAGAVQLAETGPTWQAMRLSRNRNWGHPEMISYIQRLSQSALRAGWKGLYVGDIAQPRGGPMLTGHASHQVGLDADIWMLPPSSLNLSRAQRENLSSISIRSKDQRSVNSNWTRSHHEILKAAASDPAVARIFVTAAAKLQMCKDEPRGDRAWLRKIRPWWGHHYHFHVRLNCPAGSRNCQEQAPMPAGDGCKDAVWWVTDALKPPDPNAPKPPPKKKKPPITLSSLPQSCTQVLNN